MPSTQLKLFNSQAQRALFAFQMIEETLKAYLADAHSVVRSSIPAGIRYNVPEKQYEDAPLERLLVYFATFSSNTELIKKLNALRAGRNFCAHRAFTVGFKKEVTRAGDLRDEIKKVLDIEAAADDALSSLQEEREAMSKLCKQTTRPMSSMAKAINRSK